MHAPADRSPLHRYPTLHCNDAASVASLLNGKDFALSLLRQDERGDGVQINAIDLPNVHLGYVSYNAEAIVTATPARNDYRLQLPLAGRSVSVMDRTEIICEGLCGVVSSPLYDQTIRLDADCRRLLVYFTSETLTRHLSAMLGEGIVGKIRFAPSLDLTNGAGRSLYRWISLAVDELDQSDALLNNPLALAQFEQLLLTGLVCGQPHNFSERLSRYVTVSPRSVKRAIDHIHANLHLPITVEQLVTVAGVPGRTLYKHFRQTTGLAPLVYVRKVRYERVRQELTEGTADNLTSVAARWGFEHMGRFAQGYRLLFGERPSQTMRRK